MFRGYRYKCSLNILDMFRGCRYKCSLNILDMFRGCRYKCSLNILDMFRGCRYKCSLNILDMFRGCRYPPDPPPNPAALLTPELMWRVNLQPFTQVIKEWSLMPCKYSHQYFGAVCVWFGPIPSNGPSWGPK